MKMKKSLSVLVYLLCAIFILINCTNKELSFIEDVDGLKVDSMAPFYHGVASGDPLENKVIIWTRVTPEKTLSEISVKWKMSESKDFNEIIKMYSV